MNPADRNRIALSAGLAASTALTYYAIDRTYHAFFTSEPNPAQVIWSLHAGFFWREISALYLAGFVALATFLFARRPSERSMRLLPRVLFGSVMAAFAQALFVP